MYVPKCPKVSNNKDCLVSTKDYKRVYRLSSKNKDEGFKGRFLHKTLTHAYAVCAVYNTDILVG